MTDTAAEALVADEAMTETQTEDEAYSTAFDRITEGKPIEEPDPVNEAEPEPDVAENDADEPEPEHEEKAEAPSDLPGGVKAAWESFSKEVQEAIIASQRDMAKKVSDQGRLVSGIAPIRDVLIEASKEMPHLMGMKPEQVATEIFTLAKISRDFNDRPTETMMGLIKKHGIEAQVKAALNGVEAPAEAAQATALKTEIANLQRQLQQFASPDYIRQQVSQVSSEERATSEVQNFASTAEHWAAVEEYLPQYIPVVQAEMGESASVKDILSAAYDLAVLRRLPGSRAKPQAADEAAAQVDPKKAEAAIKAKSVNVSGKSAGKDRVLSEDEALSAAYDRIARK